ncbi:MAG: hypothetical protein CMK44_04320 [Porticoccus sp.]|jgi:hypothetical protein|nr:hypothetical protein [Porticoccus sp.]|tara:strand:- start:2302 stop:3780 length:1479 start_codon:yes stop_codon:yes gene_type:complete
MTSAQTWLDMAINLYDENIAEPVFWLGDDCHREKAKKHFRDCYVSVMNDIVHYPWRLENNQYNSEFSDFFLSENYIRCKDACIKMMDRLDHIGMFNRLDREMYLKIISHWALKKVSELKPDALIVAEAPHSHAQYLIYEIFLYLDIPVVQFLSWSIQPVVMLQQVKENKLIPVEKTFSISEWKEINIKIENYIKKVSNSDNYQNFIPTSIGTQRRNSSSKLKRLSRFFSRRKLRELAAEEYRNRKFKWKKEFLPVNPQFIGVLISEWIRKDKGKNVLKAFHKNIDTCDLSQDYVYVGLHYEPERSTNPDGGPFHDQILAIVKLRKILPPNVEIYVKEHPSQFYIHKGPRGRSPLFYDAIRRIKGVRLIDITIENLSLIRNAKIVCTITGTIGLEAAALGKKTLHFGNSWYQGMPNTIRWYDGITYEEIMNLPNASPDDVSRHLIEYKATYGVPCFRNESGVGYVSAHNKSPEFAAAEVKGTAHLAKQFFKKI